MQALKSVARRADIMDTESVKGYLASAPLSEGRKEKLPDDLARFYGFKRLPFDKPRYQGIERLPFIPLETEVDQLISAVEPKLQVFLQLLKETGMRPGEAWNLKCIDIDFEKAAVTISPEKNSRPRQLGISRRLICMMNRLTRKSDYVFRNPNRDPIRIQSQLLQAKSSYCGPTAKSTY